MTALYCELHVQKKDMKLILLTAFLSVTVKYRQNTEINIEITLYKWYNWILKKATCLTSLCMI